MRTAHLPYYFPPEMARALLAESRERRRIAELKKIGVWLFDIDEAVADLARLHSTAIMAVARIKQAR